MLKRYSKKKNFRTTEWHDWTKAMFWLMLIALIAISAFTVYAMLLIQAASK